MVKRIVTLLALLAASMPGQAQESLYWSAGPALPQPTQEIYPAADDQHIFVAGGLSEDPNGIVLRDGFYRLSASQQQWQSLPVLPEPRHHAMLVARPDAVWMFGGFVEGQDGQWINTNNVLRFDRQTNRWQQKNPLPVALSETVSVVLNDKIHLIGGRSPAGEANGRWHDHKDTDWHGVFEPKAGVWKTAAPLPTPRNSACAVAYAGKIHVIGGRQVDKGNLDTHEQFDPSSGKWTTLKPLPQAQAGLACVAYRHNIYVFGGEHFVGEGGVFSEVWEYDIERQRWAQVSTMPIPRHGLGAVILADQVWLIGGAAKAGAAQTSAVVSKLKHRGE